LLLDATDSAPALFRTISACSYAPFFSSVSLWRSRTALKGVLVRVTQELDTSHMSISNLPKVAVHSSKGAIVGVAPRTGPNQNKQGGRARVTKVNGEKYDVSYVVSGGEEKGLPLELLSTPDDKNTSTRRPSEEEEEEARRVLGVDTCGVISAVWWWQWRIWRFPGTSGGMMGRGGLSSVYLSTRSLGGTTGIE
jgi:hypothetical protein